MTSLVRIVLLCTFVFAGSVWAWQPANAMAPSKTSSAHSGTQTGTSEKTNHASAQLQLALPKSAAAIPTRTVNQKPAAMDNKKTHNTFDLDPGTVVRPVTDPINLFPRKYGMRGFMTGQWLTRHFGLTAGLGIKLKRDGSPRQYVENFNLNMLDNDLLFGMGLLIAF